MTRVEKSPGAIAWGGCILCTLLGGWVCCLCLIPFCMDDCYESNHYCSQCGVQLGRRGT